MRVNGADSVWAEAREAQEQTIPSGVRGPLCRRPNYLHCWFHSPGGSVLFSSPLCAVDACGSSLPHPAGAYLFSTCQLLTNHYEQCWKYYCLPSGWGSYGLAVEEELHLTEKLFWGIFDSLSHKVMAVLLEQSGVRVAGPW